jgi:hypothetical protein
MIQTTEQPGVIFNWAETSTMTSGSNSISNSPASGDLLFFMYFTDRLTGDDGVTPTGWTNIAKNTEAQSAYNCCYKISDGTETSIAHGVTDSASLSTGTYVLASFGSVNTVATTNSGWALGNGDNNILSLGTVGATDICIQAIGVDDQVSGVAVPSGFTEALIATVGTAGNGCTVAVAYAEGFNSGNWTNNDEPVLRAALRYTQ